MVGAVWERLKYLAIRAAAFLMLLALAGGFGFCAFGMWTSPMNVIQFIIALLLSAWAAQLLGLAFGIDLGW